MVYPLEVGTRAASVKKLHAGIMETLATKTLAIAPNAVKLHVPIVPVRTSFISVKREETRFVLHVKNCAHIVSLVRVMDVGQQNLELSSVLAGVLNAAVLLQIRTKVEGAVVAVVLVVVAALQLSAHG